MRYAVLADIHANLEAFIAVKKQLDKENIDKYICLGDIVGYGANPRECIKLSKKLFNIIIAGNHDWGVAGLFDSSNFNSYARIAVEWTKKNISHDDRKFLRSLPLELKMDNFQIVHGSLCRPDEFNYILNIPDSGKTFDLMENNICFIGHSHAPVVFIKDKQGNINQHKSNKTELSKDKKYIVNVGSVGQPRDGNPKASYCIYDDKGKIEINRVSYPVTQTQEKIIGAKLPHFLAVRLGGGR